MLAVVVASVRGCLLLARLYARCVVCCTPRVQAGCTCWRCVLPVRSSPKFRPGWRPVIVPGCHVGGDGAPALDADVEIGIAAGEQAHQDA